MINFPRFVAAGLFAAAFAFAQFPWDASSSGEASDTSSSAPSIVPPPPPPPPQPPEPKRSEPSSDGKTLFDKQLRGHAYNPYSTVGAATNVNDLYIVPSDIHEQKFFYISLTDESGAPIRTGFAAFELFGGSALLGLTNSGDLGALTLGYATSAFGFALNYAVGKVWRETTTTIANNTVTYSSRTTYPGDNLGLSFSLPLGPVTFYANAGWLTYDQSRFEDNNGTESTESYSTLDATAGLTGAIGSLNYDAFAFVERHGGTFVDNSGNKAVDQDSRSVITLNLNLGYAALKSSDARVIIGLNNTVGMVFQDDIPNIQESDHIIAAIISPNILGEVALFENWLGFAGATHCLSLLAGDMDQDDDTSRLMLIHQDVLNDGEQTRAFAGVRYHKNSWALEAQISANPFEAINGGNIFANFGGFIYF